MRISDWSSEVCSSDLEGVYAVGDIVPGLQLAHRGFQQGIFVAEELAGLNPATIDESGIPRVAYSDPEPASVGLTEEQAAEKYGEVEAMTYDLGGKGKTKSLKHPGIVTLVPRTDGARAGANIGGARVGERLGPSAALTTHSQHQ